MPSLLDAKSPKHGVFLHDSGEFKVAKFYGTIFFSSSIGRDESCSTSCDLSCVVKTKRGRLVLFLACKFLGRLLPLFDRSYDLARMLS